jgi:hypothetical protein
MKTKLFFAAVLSLVFQADVLATETPVAKSSPCMNIDTHGAGYVTTPTKLHAAILAYDVAAVRKLANVTTTNVTDTYGQTALFLAVVTERSHDGLKANMIPMDQRNSEMKIYRAKQLKKQLTIINILLATGTDRTVRRCDGKSALDLARDRKSPEIIAALTK